MNDRRFSMDELGEAFGSEVADALETGRWLQGAIDDSTEHLPATATGFDAATGVRAGLGDRVMAALADEPAPAPTGFLQPLRRRGFLHGLAASFREAMVAARGTGRPMLSRAAALAYVLVLTVAGLSLTGAASLGAAGALGILGPSRSPAVPSLPPNPTLPPTTAPVAPTATPSVPPDATSSPAPTPTASPSESPEESDDHGGNSGPGGGDDDDNSGPGSSSSGSSSDDSGPGSEDSGSGSDSSGPGSGDDDETPRPSRTPKPGETSH